MGLLTSKIIAPLLLVPAFLISGYGIAAPAGTYYPCSLPALTAHQAKQRVGHFMRTAGINQHALNLIDGLKRMGAGAEIIDRLAHDCQDCFLHRESIGPLQGIWAASLTLPRKAESRHPDWVMGTQHVDIHIGSCQAVWIERSWFDRPDF